MLYRSQKFLSFLDLRPVVSGGSVRRKMAKMPSELLTLLANKGNVKLFFRSRVSKSDPRSPDPLTYVGSRRLSNIMNLKALRRLPCWLHSFLRPERTVERPILDRFGDVLRFEQSRAVEVGD